MKDYRKKFWKKMTNAKHKPFRSRRSLRNVKADQIIKTRYDVLIKVAVLDKVVLYIMPSESF